MNKIRDEISRVPTGVAGTVAGLTDKVELPQVDIRHVADQVTEKLTGGTKRRRVSSPIVGAGVLLLLVIVVFRIRARNGHDDETT